MLDKSINQIIPEIMSRSPRHLIASLEMISGVRAYGSFEGQSSQALLINLLPPQPLHRKAFAEAMIWEQSLV